MRWLAQGVEALASKLNARGSTDSHSPDYDAVVIGSGYGGSVAAYQFAKAGYTVCLLERGAEFVPGEFLNDPAHLPAQLRIHRAGEPGVIGKPDGLFDVRIHDGVTVLVANALGGGSQINANVALRADPEVFRDTRWPEEFRKHSDPLDAWYTRVEDFLEVRPYEAACRKADQLGKAAGAISAWLRKNEWQGETPPEARFYRPPLAITQRDGVNRSGVYQRACTGCGDCVTGCNVGAKNTLTMNYLPQAKRYGADLYTGATVLAVKPGSGGASTVWFCYSDADWSEFFAEDRPADEQALRQPGIFGVKAGIVVLAAGTFGSTEILLRSRQLGLLAASPRLGAGFSGNGDALGFGFDQDEPVNAIGQGADARRYTTSASDAQPPGPSIAAVLDVRSGLPLGSGMLIEDGILPGAVAHIGHELLTTAAMLEQFASWRLRRGGYGEDPLALSDEALRRTQVYLAIGHDSADGTLSLKNGRVALSWRSAARQPAVARAQQYIRLAANAAGGIPLSNPLTHPLPEKLAQALSGPSLEGAAAVVHPLGGCAMGEDFESGVVDHIGAVFDGKAPRSVYRSLFVWDGSIVPTSIGANPFLTIAALSERAADLALERIRDSHQSSDLRPVPRSPMVWRLPAVPPFESRQGGRIGVSLRETMRGTLRLHPDSMHSPVGDGEAAIELRMETADLMVLLKDPRHSLSKLEGSLTMPALDAKAALRIVGGQVNLLTRVPSTRIGRTARAFATWYVKRGRSEIVQAVRVLLAGKRPRRNLRRLVVELLQLANRAGERRAMRYVLALEGAQGERYTLRGEKLLSYSTRSNAWDSLLDLRAEIRREADHRLVADGVLRVDLIALADRNFPQITAARDTPNAFLGLVSFALFFLRAVLNTHIWDLRKPEYPPRVLRGPVQGQRPLLADTVALDRGVRVHAERHWLEVPRSAKDDHKVPLALTRMKPPVPALVPPILMLAGFAQSARAFIAEPLHEDLVRHLLQRGFEVWLFDYRTSIALPSSRTQCSLDAVAAFDIPAAVDHIIATTGCPSIGAIGHCMGSATLAMSLLSGKLLDSRGRSKVTATVLSQVPPLIIGGSYSQWRRRMASLARDAFGVRLLNLAADDSATGAETLMDRLFATLPVGAERCPGELACDELRTDIATCKRVSGIIGPLYRHANVTLTHRLLSSYFGWASVSVFNHISKFFQYERLVSADGANVYVTDENIREGMRIPVLLMHGERNSVFDPESSRRSLEELRRVNGEGLYELFCVKDYAHFDCLIGDRAHRDVFPRISEFLLRTTSMASRTTGREHERSGDIRVDGETSPAWAADRMDSARA